MWHLNQLSNFNKVTCKLPDCSWFELLTNVIILQEKSDETYIHIKNKNKKMCSVTRNSLRYMFCSHYASWDSTHHVIIKYLCRYSPVKTLSRLAENVYIHNKPG